MHKIDDSHLSTNMNEKVFKMNIFHNIIRRNVVIRSRMAKGDFSFSFV